MRTVRVGLIGLGTVGSGVSRSCARHGEDFRRRAGVDIELARFADRNTRALRRPRPARRAVHDRLRTTSSTTPRSTSSSSSSAAPASRARSCSPRSSAGKSVVTANKALLASHGEEVMAGGRGQRRRHPLRGERRRRHPDHRPAQALADQQRDRQTVMGIVNGTTNYMLTRMAEDGLDYDTALAEAQAQGLRRGRPDRRRRRPRRRRQDRDPVRRSRSTAAS